MPTALQPKPLKAAIYEAGYTITGLAEELGVEMTHLSAVVGGHRKPSELLKRATARVLGRDLTGMWPA